MQVSFKNSEVEIVTSREKLIKQFCKRLKNKALWEDDKLLWRAVLCQALEDFIIRSKNVRKLCFKRRSVEWFENHPEDVKEICELAGVKYSYIKKLTET